MEVELETKTTWNLHKHLKKVDVIRLYNALTKSSNREKDIRRMIYFPPEHTSTFSNLIKRITRVFDKHECPHSNYKNDCYKEFKHVLNEFQESLSDSGEPVRFTLIETPTPTPTKRTPTPTKRTPNPIKRTPNPIKRTPTPTKGFPAPLPPSENNLIYNLSNLRIKMFIQMILNCKTSEEKREFLQKYFYIFGANDEPFPDLVNDLIVDILETNSELLDSHFNYLMSKYGPDQPRDSDYTKLHILYPFPVMYGLNRRGRTTHDLGRGGKRRRTRKRKMKH